MLVLFDLDGTLVATRRAGLEAFLEASAELFGRALRCERTRIDGNLDPLIWDGLCAENGIDDGRSTLAPFRERYAQRLREKLAEPGRARSLPGASELIAALRGRPQVAVGLLTGNWADTGAAKLEAAGLELAAFDVRVWGDDAPSRPELVPVAIERHRELGGAPLEPDRVVVIGDTPWDVECARANGARSIGVATGRFAVDELRRAGADAAIATLEDARSIVAWIERREPIAS